MSDMKKRGRHQVISYLEELGSCPISFEDHDDLREALLFVSREIGDAKVQHVVLVDTKTKVVKIKKGSVDVFREGLDVRLPGWSLG